MLPEELSAKSEEFDDFNWKPFLLPAGVEAYWNLGLEAYIIVAVMKLGRG